MQKNYMEDMVAYWVLRMLSERRDKYKDVCKCDRCMEEMCVAALNRLPVYCMDPNSPEALQAYPEVYEKMQEQVAAAVEKAIAVVSSQKEMPVRKRV